MIGVGPELYRDLKREKKERTTSALEWTDRQRAGSAVEGADGREVSQKELGAKKAVHCTSSRLKVAIAVCYKLDIIRLLLFV